MMAECRSRSGHGEKMEEEGASIAIGPALSRYGFGITIDRIMISLLSGHDPSGKPVPAFADHAPTRQLPLSLRSLT
jgi:hypothetical protein